MADPDPNRGREQEEENNDEWRQNRRRLQQRRHVVDVRHDPLGRQDRPNRLPPPPPFVPRARQPAPVQAPAQQQNPGPNNPPPPPVQIPAIPNRPFRHRYPQMFIRLPGPLPAGTTIHLFHPMSASPVAVLPQNPLGGPAPRIQNIPIFPPDSLEESMDPMPGTSRAPQ